MALCGLAASSASAEEMPHLTEPLHLTTCAFVAGEGAFTPDETRCVTITISDQKSWDEYVAFDECMEAIGVSQSQMLEQQEEELHNCAANASNADSGARDRRKQRHHRHHHRVRHAHKRAHRG
jgi:hypothetical protein